MSRTKRSIERLNVEAAGGMMTAAEVSQLQDDNQAILQPVERRFRFSKDGISEVMPDGTARPVSGQDFAARQTA